jgi:hypothetical protein
MEDVKIEALDLKQGGKDARDLSRKMRVVVKVITGWWGGGEEQGEVGDV